MILVAAIVVAVGIGLVRGGKLSRVAELPLQWGWVVLFALGMQAFVVWGPAWVDSISFLEPALMLISYVLLCGVAWTNRRLPGIWLAGLGLVLNGAVIIANGGHMPISPQTLARLGHGEAALKVPPGTLLAGSKDVVLLTEQTRLWPLSDIFVIPRPWPLATAFSVGDVLIAAGIFILLQWILLGSRGASACFLLIKRKPSPFDSPSHPDVGSIEKAPTPVKEDGPQINLSGESMLK